MTSLLQALFPCLPIGERGIQLTEETTNISHLSGKFTTKFYTDEKNGPKLSSDEAAISIISAMLDADKAGPSLKLTIQSLVHQAGGWSEYLGKKIVAGLEAVLKAGKKMNAAMEAAYNKAVESVKTGQAKKEFQDFVAEHPYETAVFCTLIALGILVELTPVALGWLGFAEAGIVENSWAAAWQARYMGMVPKGSLFSYFQRLGMTLKWKL